MTNVKRKEIFIYNSEEYKSLLDVKKAIENDIKDLLEELTVKDMYIHAKRLDIFNWIIENKSEITKLLNVEYDELSDEPLHEHMINVLDI